MIAEEIFIPCNTQLTAATLASSFSSEIINQRTNLSTNINNPKITVFLKMIKIGLIVEMATSSIITRRLLTKPFWLLENMDFDAELIEGIVSEVPSGLSVGKSEFVVAIRTTPCRYFGINWFGETLYISHSEV